MTSFEELTEEKKEVVQQTSPQYVIDRLIQEYNEEASKKSLPTIEENK